ncbi:MAG: DUF5106 domain-containing protein [Bacteroidales bacterium]|nr:DUF5106 domain-containing protein [Bacteroidales bacterium]
MKNILPILTLTLLLLSSCKTGTGSKAAPRPFPMCEVPAMYSSPDDRIAYGAEHYWDKFFIPGQVTDSSLVCGVPNQDVEQAVSNYIYLLNMEPKATAQAQVAAFFSKLETAQKQEPNGLLYLRMTEIVSSYLYDPNSPYRDEDLYLPFVRGMAASECTAENVRHAYEYEAAMCAMNQWGQQVPDFRYVDARGRSHRLYDTKADYTILFFSNPGCQDCRDIINTLTSREYLDPAIKSGSLAVVNIYIDEDWKAWKEYEPNYPRNWSTGYDPDLVIRNNELYCVRAIPSLYLLDTDKKVIFKDAPVERVLAFLDEIQQ